MARDLKRTIAIAGAGDMAKYLVEEINADGTFQAVVMGSSESEMRATPQAKVHCLILSQKRDWFEKQPNVFFLVTDYSVDSVVEILDEFEAISLFAFWVTWDEPAYVRVHNQLIDATQMSKTCKRYHGSEMIGDIEKYPWEPRHYRKTRIPIRQRLAAQTEIEHTTLVLGTFLDYALPDYQKTYLKDYGTPPLIDVEKSVVRWPGNTDVTIGWTPARDVMKAAVRICKFNEWEPYYYIVGQNLTFKQLAEEVKSIYGRDFMREPADTAGLEEYLDTHPESTMETMPYEVHAWLNSGAVEVPGEKVTEQRQKFFHGIHFRNLAEVIEDYNTKDMI